MSKHAPGEGPRRRLAKPPERERSSARAPGATILAVAVALLGVGILRATAAELTFERQVITFPTNSASSARPEISSRFADLDGDGLADLLALSVAENRLWIYRQRQTGFPSAPDQTISLPEGTAWIGVRDVDPSPGAELLVSTAEGVSYFRQNGGAFENEPHRFVEAVQPFAKETASFVAWLPSTNPAIPLLSSDHVILYQRDANPEWKPGPPLPLHLARTTWNLQQENWMLGTGTARRLRINEDFRRDATTADEEWPENEAIKKLLQESGSANAWYGWTQQERVDINGDGREDVVVQRVSGALDTKTDIFIFLRNAEAKLPERPTQILHCSGFPLASGPERKVSVVCDLDGDGLCELLVAAPKVVIASSSGLVEMIVSKGVNIAVNIRALHRGVYSKSPDASVDIIGALAPDRGAPELYIVDGDFNGDGRKDLLIRRTLLEWNVYFSSKLGTWFQEKPALKLESPVDGSPEIQDLNGDGFSDLAVKGQEEPRIAIFLSRQQRAK